MYSTCIISGTADFARFVDKPVQPQRKQQPAKRMTARADWNRSEAVYLLLFPT